jgi:predicted DNA-binding protein (UPF0251 family)
VGRPPCCRRILSSPAVALFAPAPAAGQPVGEVVIALDEFEAIRLADLEGLYQEAAATRMRISRATFGRIVESGRRKIAEALVHGKVLRIEGGPVAMEPSSPSGGVGEGSGRRGHGGPGHCCGGGRRLA